MLFQRPLRTSAPTSHPDYKHRHSDPTRASGGGLGDSERSQAEQEQHEKHEQRTQGGKQAKQAKQAKRTSRLDVVASFSMHVVVHQATVLLMHRQKMFAFLRTSGVDLTSSGLVRVTSSHQPCT